MFSVSHLDVIRWHWGHWNTSIIKACNIQRRNWLGGNAMIWPAEVRGNVWRKSAGSRITACWNVRTPHPPTLTQKQTHLSGSTRYKAPDAYVQLRFIYNGCPNMSIEHTVYTLCTFLNEMCFYCILVCRVYGHAL